MSITQDFIQYLLDEGTENAYNFDYKDRGHEIDVDIVYEAIVKTDNPVAYRILGNELLVGIHNVRRDRKRGISLIRSSARKGDSIAQEKMAHIYEGRFGVKRNSGKMVYYYEEAVKNGKINCAYDLIRIHLRGIHGVKRDIYKAINYYRIVKEKGDANLECIVNNMLIGEYKVEILYYFMENEVKLKERIKQLEGEIVELKYRPNGQGYEEALADFTKLSE